MTETRIRVEQSNVGKIVGWSALILTALTVLGGGAGFAISVNQNIKDIVPGVSALLKATEHEEQIEMATSLDDAHRALGRIEGKCEAEILRRLFDERYGGG